MSGTGEGVFGPVIDDLIKLSRTPTLVVRGRTSLKTGLPAGYWSRPVPARVRRNAADLAFAIAGADVVVTGVHVVTPSRLSGSGRTSCST